MEIGQLEAFDRAARDGNFTRAAESLGLTQPAVSTRITTLEAELGGALFERRGRELRLTSLGVQFLPYAQRMLAVMADSLQVIHKFKSGRLGEVKIAAPTPFVLSFLVEILRDFRQHYPSVDIFVRERPKTAIFDMLRDNVVTLGLVNAPVYNQQFTQLASFQDPIRAVVAKSHPLADLHNHQGAILMQDIYQHTIFRVSMFPQMTAFVDTVVEHGRIGSGGAVIKVPMVMALRLASLGDGITFLPERYVAQSINDGELIYLNIEDMPKLYSQPVLVCAKDRRLDDIHHAFVDVLKAQLSHLTMVD